MGTKEVIRTLKNNLNAAIGRKQALMDLIENNDIGRLQSKMTYNGGRVSEALKQYDPRRHKVMYRPDKIRKGKDPKIVNKLSIPYQKEINKQATAFLFGSPIQFSNNSEKGKADKAFEFFQQILKDTRFDSNIRTCKTIAGAETECAKLYHLYLDDKDNVQVIVKILAQSMGDKIYTRFDDFGRMVMFGRGYKITDMEGQDENHFDVYTSETIYRAVQKALGWEVTTETNFIGKIPVLYYSQDTEWGDVQTLIERRESILSKSADTIDYHASPKLVAEGDIKGLPDPDDPGEVFVLNSQGKVSYLTYDSAPESRLQECRDLERFIYSMTGTADISFDSIKDMSIPSGVAWEYVFMSPLIKARNHQDKYGELIDREINVIKAIMGVMRPELVASGELDALDISFTFSTPMPNDLISTLDEIQKAIDTGTMSRETAVGLNPMIKDPKEELIRLQKEETERQLNQDVEPEFNGF